MVKLQYVKILWGAYCAMESYHRHNRNQELSMRQEQTVEAARTNLFATILDETDGMQPDVWIEAQEKLLKSATDAES